MNTPTLHKQINRVGKGYDKVAFIYDKIVELFFGKSLLKIQEDALAKSIPFKSILIIGGGSGAVLDFILKHQHESKIMYWEASSKMIAKAQKRFYGNLNTDILFIKQIEEVDNPRADVILLPFVLDCYEADSIRSLLQQCRTMLNKRGSIIIIDFNQDIRYGFKENKIKTLFIKALTQFFYTIKASESTGLSNIFMLSESVLGKGEELEELRNGWIKAYRFRPSNLD